MKLKYDERLANFALNLKLRRCSAVVDAAISNKALYEGVMKPMARRTMISTAEKNGILWQEIVARLQVGRCTLTL